MTGDHNKYSKWISMSQTEIQDSYRCGSSVPVWKQKSARQQWFGGLLPTLWFYALVTTSTLVTNIAWLTVAVRKYGVSSGYGTLQEGNCEEAERLNLWLHLGINVLSSGLLAGSNAFMAAASAPSREEIDRAHRQNSSLRIGLLSFANFRHISRRKGFACMMLALTSIPIHVVYNAVVFSSLFGNDYIWVVVAKDFLNGAPIGSEVPTEYVATIQFLQAHVAELEELNNKDCLEIYTQTLLSDRSNVVLVSTFTNATDSVLRSGIAGVDVSGDLSPLWSQSWETPTAANLTFQGRQISHCRSQSVAQKCSVRFSIALALTVIVCNVLKLLVELYLLLSGHLNGVMTCVGDAIASFMSREDKYSQNMCLLSDIEIDRFKHSPAAMRPPKQHTPGRTRWHNAVSRRRWLLCLTIMGMFVILGSISALTAFLRARDKNLDYSTQDFWRAGFGKFDSKSLIAPGNFGNPNAIAVIANTPQLILAVISYLVYGILVAFLTAREYSNFGVHPQHLRVASPAGKQRSTWLLGMPLAWGFVYLAMQTLLHWFVSQSLFMVQVKIAVNQIPDLHYYSDVITNCGYSGLAMVCSVVTALCMTLLLVGLGFLRRFPEAAPPVTKNKSLIIAAACHPGIDNDRARFERLQWGAICFGPDNVGHCSFGAAENGAGVLPKVDQLVQSLFYK